MDWIYNLKPGPDLCVYHPKVCSDRSCDLHLIKNIARFDA